MFWAIMGFYFAIIMAIAGLIYLKADRDDISFYGHLIQWFISPLLICAGLIFLDNSRKGRYFKSISKNLFIKK
jgi:hypothetical protein